jgi:hypothetical protein
MAGFFPSVPQQVNFEMLFAPVSGQWRLFGLSVNIGQSGPVAPQPPSAGALPRKAGGSCEAGAKARTQERAGEGIRVGNRA